MDLFEYAHQNKLKEEAPLASRLRPKTLDEFMGQKHILSRGSHLYRSIQADKLSSVIFYGPSGTGKTTLARVIANTTAADFQQINATVAGKKDMVEIVEQAKVKRGAYNRKTILFIDEIHRFNKAQQDFLLPFVEDGTVILIGATTENPYFEVNSALISRSTVFELKPLDKEDIRKILIRAIKDPERGMGMYHAVIEDDALEFLSDFAGGDARCALNAIELAILTTEPSDAADLPEIKNETVENSRGREQVIRLTSEVIEQCVQKKNVRYDKNGDQHYDVISAFIKSMRGSDPDAAVYYLARMLYAGEDVNFIARRIMICAAEDVGCADPRALQVAVAAQQAVHVIGMPEARIILAEAVLYVCGAPKSNSAIMAIDNALEAVRTTDIKTVPPHLQDAHYGGAKHLERGIGYQYAHDFPEHYVRQQYLPDELTGAKFYEPGDLGYEKTMKERLDRLKKRNE
ncbi:MAG: replication-associated recombination protein A [Parasporobacterium sp.]|nr:replication-associated recombination protein A [Parasporobacterium sp.]